MDPMTALEPGDFLRLINRTDVAFRLLRKRRELLLWNEPPKRRASDRLDRIAYDAAAFLTSFGFVSFCGVPWAAVAAAAPGLQFTLRDGVDRRETYAAIRIISKSEFICGAGSWAELQKEGVIGLPHHTMIQPLPPIVDYLRRRAAEHNIKLPQKLAPPPGEIPVWARGNPRWATPGPGGARVTWEPTGAFQLTAVH